MIAGRGAPQTSLAGSLLKERLTGKLASLHRGDLVMLLDSDKFERKPGLFILIDIDRKTGPVGEWKLTLYEPGDADARNRFEVTLDDVMCAYLYGGQP